jgi:hypothetical protein
LSLRFELCMTRIIDFMAFLMGLTWTPLVE